MSSFSFLLLRVSSLPPPPTDPPSLALTDEELLSFLLGQLIKEKALLYSNLHGEAAEKITIKVAELEERVSSRVSSSLPFPFLPLHLPSLTSPSLSCFYSSSPFRPRSWRSTKPRPSFVRLCSRGTATLSRPMGRRLSRSLRGGGL